MKNAFDAAAAEKMTTAQIAAFLSEKQRRFAEEVLVDGNATEAAIRAGYSKKRGSAAVQGSKLMRDERVIAYRRAMLRDMLADKDISKENLALRLSEIMDRCMQAEPVFIFVDGKRVESGVWEFNANGAIKAAAELIRLFGFAAPTRIENTGAGALEKFIMDTMTKGD